MRFLPLIFLPASTDLIGTFDDFNVEMWHAPRHRSSGRHSRSRWRRSRYGDTVRHVSIFEDAVRRQRISRTEICESACKGSEHFFEHYKDLEKGKWVKVLRWGGAE